MSHEQEKRMQDFKNLNVWQKAYELSLLIYRITSSFPASEQFGLTSQIRRSTVSIAANIAEGRGRGSDPDFRRFIQIAIGSICELECHIMLARDLEFLRPVDYDQVLIRIEEIRKMLIALSQCLQAQGSRLKAQS
jgi:four helix bundle protein